jgi:hypothetical protein
VPDPMLDVLVNPAIDRRTLADQGSRAIGPPTSADPASPVIAQETSADPVNRAIDRTLANQGGQI